MSHVETHIWNPLGLPDHWHTGSAEIVLQGWLAASPQDKMGWFPSASPSFSLSFSFSPKKWRSGACLQLWGAIGEERRESLGTWQAWLTQLQNIERGQEGQGLRGPLTPPGCPHHGMW